MPPLKNRLRGSLPGFAPQEQQPAISPTVSDPGKLLGSNAFVRCPLPPFNVSPDTLRQFNESGQTPTRRVIPLPVSTAAGGNTVINNNTTITGSSSSSSSSSTFSGFTPKTVTINAPTLLPGVMTIGTLTAAKAAVLMTVGSSDLCEVRIYGDPTSQTIDIPRASDTAPAFEQTPGLVTDVILDTLPLKWAWQNRVYVNQDSPQTTNLYITVLNPTAVAVTPIITITYLPLE